MYELRDAISSVDELRALLGEVPVTQRDKQVDKIDEHCRRWIERSPFLVVASAGTDGTLDVSPRGDPPGFVKILDEHTLAIPDRPGNRRGDTLHNVLHNPQLALVFFVPRRGEVLRVGGRASLVCDPDLLASMTVKQRQPKLAIVLRVDRAMFHCAKAIIRSSLWQPDEWPSIDGLPSYAQALMDHAAPPFTLEQMQQRVTNNEEQRLYDDKPF